MLDFALVCPLFGQPTAGQHRRSLRVLFTKLSTALGTASVGKFPCTVAGVGELHADFCKGCGIDALRCGCAPAGTCPLDHLVGLP